jgi:hypothetical protein
VRSVADSVLTVVPGFVQYPPELAYPPVSHTREPAVVLREVGPSRLAYFPGDIERTFWLTGHGDLLRLMHNTMRWITHDQGVVRVDGDGLVELFAWETAPGYTIHLLNYANPNAYHGWLSGVYPLASQTVSLELPSGTRVKAVDLLRSERSIPFRLDRWVLRFTIPRVDDYEIAAVSVG